MKIAITATGQTINDQINPQFGRAQGFIVYDSTTQTTSYLSNSNAQSGSSAGIGTAQMLLDEGIEAVISGQVGPKALNVLTQAGLTIYQCDTMAISAAIEKFSNGLLTEQNG